MCHFTSGRGRSKLFPGGFQRADQPPCVGVRIDVCKQAVACSQVFCCANAQRRSISLAESASELALPRTDWLHTVTKLAVTP